MNYVGQPLPIPIQGGITPNDGQVLTWNGTAWVPANVNSGGSSGGVIYFLKEQSSPQAPITGLTAPVIKQLGTTAESSRTSYTKAGLSGVSYTQVIGFVTNLNTPGAPSIPAGIWVFNVWAETNNPNVNSTHFRVSLYTYDGTTATLIHTSNEVGLLTGNVEEYDISLAIPPITISVTDRIYVVLEAISYDPGYDITFYFGDATPSYVITTIPTVQGTGIVHVVDGQLQSPAGPVQLNTGDISGVLPVHHGGTGLSTIPTDGQLLIGNGSGYTLTTLTAGPSIEITNSSGSITITNTGVRSVVGASPISSSGGYVPVISLNNSGVVDGTYGTSSAIPTITVTAKGLVTNIVETSIQIAQSQVTNLNNSLNNKVDKTTSVNAGTGLIGGGDLSTDRTISMPNVGTASTYGSAASVPVFTTDAQGRVSAVTNTSIAINGNQITSGVVAVANGGTGLSTAPTNGQLLIGNGAGYTLSTLSTGSGVSVTNGSGSITLTNTGVLTVGATAPIASSGGQNPNISINNSGVVAGTYGTASSVGTFTVTAKGLISSAVNTPIAIVASQVTSGTFPSGVSVQNIYQDVSAAISSGSTTLALGEVVYLKNSGGSASFPAVDRAIASSNISLNTLGIVATVAGIPNNNTGSVVVKGVLTGLNTNAFVQGDILYVSATTAGALTNVAPTYPNLAIPVGIVVVRNATQGAIFVDTSLGLDAAPQVKMPAPSVKQTFAASTYTSILSANFSNPAIEYLVLDFSGSGNVTLSGGATGPIQSLTSSDYGRKLTVHNISTKTMTFTSGGTTYLTGGTNLVLNPNSIVSFIWSFVGGGVGRWIQVTPALTVT